MSPSLSSRASLVVVLVGGSAGCAFPPDDVHLAPLYSYHRLAAGGYSHEALGGILEYRKETGGARLLGNTGAWGVGTQGRDSTEIAIRPLFRRQVQEYPEGFDPRAAGLGPDFPATVGNVASETDVLWPFGHFLSDPIESYGRFFPFWWWQSHYDDQGRYEYDWTVFPFLWGGGGNPENRYFAFFPFFGKLRDFFTYDEITFFLFPLYGSTRKTPNDRRGYAILFPITGWGSGDDGSSWWRFWPFVGHSQYPDHYDRWFIAWPFWHSERNKLDTESPSREWALLPFYGEVDEGAMHSRTLLWPFFGWQWNGETGYSAWTAPWPLVRAVRNGDGRPTSVTRVLPFYIDYEGDEIRSVVYAWPFIWLRDENTPDAERASTYVIPFYFRERATQHLKTADGKPWDRPASLDLYWPLYRNEEERDADGRGQTDILWPLPAPRVRGLRENWYPFFSLFGSTRWPDGSRSDRAFLDLFRCETNAQETRWSLPILGGHRSTADGLSEWSLLLGLVRWQSGPSGTRFLLPAIPGPGFSPLPPADGGTK